MSRKQISAKEARKIAQDTMEQAERRRQEYAEEEARRSECPDCADLTRQRDELLTVLTNILPVVPGYYNRTARDAHLIHNHVKIKRAETVISEIDPQLFKQLEKRRRER